MIQETSLARTASRTKAPDLLMIRAGSIPKSVPTIPAVIVLPPSLLFHWCLGNVNGLFGWGVSI